MKLRAGLMAVTLILSRGAFGDGDRVILVTSLAHREGNTDKPYMIVGEIAGGKPTVYYELNCEPTAARLKIGHRYKAQIRGTKTLLIFLDTTSSPTSSGIEGIECEVKSDKTTAQATGPLLPAD